MTTVDVEPPHDASSSLGKRCLSGEEYPRLLIFQVLFSAHVEECIAATTEQQKIGHRNQYSVLRTKHSSVFGL